MSELTGPEIRDELHETATEIQVLLTVQRDVTKRTEELAIRVAELAEATRRRPPSRRAPPQSEPMTPERAARIRRYAAMFPHRTEHQIAVRFKVNQGRVSEALNGKRGES